MLIPAALSYNANREKTIDVENLVNIQPEFTYGGRQPAALITTPDLTEFSAATGVASEGRGAIEVNGIMYAVIGTQLYKFSDAGVATALGSIDGTGICRLSASLTEIHIAVFDTGYVFNIGTEVLTKITDAGYPQGRTTAYINGRFVIEDPTPATSGRFYYSDVLDGTTWNELNFATAERKTDDGVSVWASGESLLIFGTRSVEFWTPTASGFDPVTNAVLPYGLIARYSLAEVAGVVFFLDSNGQVRALSGYNSQVISTPAVEALLASNESAEGSAYVFEGKTIYEISTSTATICYDLTTSQLMGFPVWFQKSTSDGRFKGRGCIFAHDKLLQLAYDDRKVYELSRTAIPDEREFTVQIPVDDDVRAWVRLHEIELIGRSGTGAIPDTDPKVMLRISRNNGYVKDEEKWVGIGTVGDYAKRIRWRRLGRFLQMSLTFRMTDAYDWTVLGIRLRGG